MIRTSNRLSALPFERLLEAMAEPMGAARWEGSLLRSPETEIVETEDSLRVLMELPGVRREELEIGLEENVLTVSGTKHREENGEGRLHLAERRYGTFTRAFVLPRDVNADRIEAEYADGVLRISVPKAERARRRRIEVRSGDGAQRLEATAGDGDASR
jgi:HSP20 family protein